MNMPLRSAPILCLLISLAAAPGATRAEPEADDRVVAVHIVSRPTGSDAIADDAPKRVRADIGVTLHAVLEVERAGKRVFHSDVAEIRLRGKTHPAASLQQAPPAELLWYKVEPATENLSNTESGSFRFERIEYREVLMRSWMLRASGPADVKPTITTDRGNGVGTMRYKVTAYTADGVVSSPGMEARRKRSSGGLRDTVHRVSLRRDDSYLGLMTEMYGQPYIWASAGTTDRKHQTERLEGSDCADLMVYGMRRLGHEIPYTWTGGLHEYTRTLARGSLRSDGVYVDKRGDPIPFTRVGDLLLFPRHVGALAEDRGTIGVLDIHDIMMHTLFASPREQPIADSGYASMPLEVVRWNKPI